MKEKRQFQRVPMSEVPDPVNLRTQSSEIWPLFEAIIGLTGSETQAIKVPIRSQSDANSMMNKLKKWGAEYAPGKRLLNNRDYTEKAMYIWWVAE